MPDCPECGYPVTPPADTPCPKCSTDVRRSGTAALLEIDIVHQGESWEEAREKLLRGLNQALLFGHSGLKVIHGHGSTTGRAVIADYAKRFMKAQATHYGGRFTADRGNPGASILWLNR